MRTPQYAPGSVGLLRPAWYERQLVNRPKGMARRGPARPVRLKVEDVPRVDAQQLYRDAQPFRMRLATTYRRGEFAGFEWEHFEPGTRVTNVGGTEVLLSPRQWAPTRSAKSDGPVPGLWRAASITVFRPAR